MNLAQRKNGLRKNTSDISIIGYNGQESSKVSDLVAVEEPLEIFINSNLFHTTMRSPGEEIPLAVGYCYTRGVIHSIDDFLSIAYCNEESGNRIDLFLPPSDKKSTDNSKKQKTSSISYSSCGICGTDIIKDMCDAVPPKDITLTIEDSRIAFLSKVLESKQEIFPITGGAHAAGIFDGLGNLLAFSEDVGRHNALDKAIGLLVLERKHKEPCVVVLTSRLSYEMVQKVTRLNAEIVIGTSSPTSLAVELARSVNMTLIEFSRDEKGYIFTCPERVILDRGMRPDP
jgi:FdhD protein